MTDQEKAALELSIALIDQAIATEDTTAATKNLKDATNMESDASIDLTDSKERVTDQMNDLEYSLHEQNRAEKRYLNVLSRRLEIEKKIGLVDYSQIDKALHDKIVAELEKRLKAEQEKNKKEEEENSEEEETETKRKKSEADYLKEAEKFHKKQIGMFKRIQDSHKNYMQNSNSFLGRLAMGALGKGTSELINVVDSATDMIPGAKTAKRVGGFVRDQWRESKELKRQDKIQKTAGFLRAKDEESEIEERKQKERDDTSRESKEGIFGIGTKLEKIFVFLKKLGESLMLMGIFRSMIGLVGSAIAGLGGIISKGLTSALTGLGIMGVLKGILGVLTTGISALASKFGIKLPDSFGDADVDKKNPKPKEKTPTKPNPKPKGPGKFTRIWDATKNGAKGLAGFGASALRGGAQLAGRVGAGITGAVSAPVAVGAGAMLYSSKVGEGSDDVSKFQDPNYRAEVAARNKRSMLEGYDKEYKDSYGDKPLVDKRGNVYYYPNPDNLEEIKVENERRFHMDTSTGMVENNEKTFNELTSAATALQDAEDANKEAARSATINSIGQQSTVNNINNSYKSNSQFGFSPFEYSSKDRYSRGEIK